MRTQEKSRVRVKKAMPRAMDNERAPYGPYGSACGAQHFRGAGIKELHTTKAAGLKAGLEANNGFPYYATQYYEYEFASICRVIQHRAVR